jgi:hypothetical protein
VGEAVPVVRVDPVVVDSVLTAVVSVGGAVCDGVYEVVAVDVVFIDVDVGEGGSFEDAVSADEPLPTHPDSPAPAQSVAIARSALRRVRRS